MLTYDFVISLGTGDHHLGELLSLAGFWGNVINFFIWGGAVDFIPLYSGAISLGVIQLPPWMISFNIADIYIVIGLLWYNFK